MSAPLLVAVTGTKRMVSRIASLVKRDLIRRGLRVTVTQEPEEKASKESDVVLIPCPVREWKKLTLHLEETWNRKWLTWYAQKHPLLKK